MPIARASENEDNLSRRRREFAVSLVRQLRQNSYPAYLVGGCVRDRLLGKLPKDFDISTAATPTEVLRLFPDSLLVGAHFGVVLVRQSPDVQVEVATFRSEGDYSDGRRPDQVRFETDPRADALRRDFTVNGLFEDPITGEVLDFIGGRRDLEARTIRAIGDPERRFREDQLRLLRAVRFAARLHFSIEEDTGRAIHEHAALITDVSAERVREELLRILTEGNAKYGFELLSQTGLLRYLLPEVEAFHGVEQPPQFHPEGDVWTHVLMMLDAMGRQSPTLAWGVLLHDVGKPGTFRRAPDRIRFDGHAELGADISRDILSRLKFANADLEQITSLVANHMRFKDVKNMRLSTLKRFLRLPHFDEHLELHRLDCLASNGYTEAYQYVQDALQAMEQEVLAPPKLITGKDLLQAGYKPGPEFKAALEAVETAQLEGEIATSEQALALAKQYLGPKANETASCE